MTAHQVLCNMVLLIDFQSFFLKWRMLVYLVFCLWWGLNPQCPYHFTS
jgi:hypothetical protein